MMDNVSYVQGPALGNYSPPAHFNCLFEQGVGGLEGHIGLPALQPVPCLSGSCVGGEGHGCLVYQIYVIVALWCSGSVLASHARGPGFNSRAG